MGTMRPSRSVSIFLVRVAERVLPPGVLAGRTRPSRAGVAGVSSASRSGGCAQSGGGCRLLTMFVRLSSVTFRFSPNLGQARIHLHPVQPAACLLVALRLRGRHEEVLQHRLLVLALHRSRGRPRRTNRQVDVFKLELCRQRLLWKDAQPACWFLLARRSRNPRTRVRVLAIPRWLFPLRGLSRFPEPRLELGSGVLFVAQHAFHELALFFLKLFEFFFQLELAALFFFHEQVVAA